MEVNVTWTSSGFILFGFDNPGVLSKYWSRVMRVALLNAFRWWVFRRKDVHFEFGQRREWPGVFFSRKQGTISRKRKRYGHDILLVEHPSGKVPHDRETLEGMMQMPPTIKSPVHGRYVSGTWKAKQIDQRYANEITAINAKEIEAMAEVVRATILGALSGPAGRGGGRVPWKRRYLSTSSSNGQIIPGKDSYELRRIKSKVFRPSSLSGGMISMGKRGLKFSPISPSFNHGSGITPKGFVRI